MTINASNVAAVLGSESELGRRVANLDDLRHLVEEGLPVAALDRVVVRVTRDDRSAAELKYRLVPKTTLRRRVRLDPEESQRLERLARMTVLAEQVWESPDLAHEFLTSMQHQLDGERPVDLARSDIGTRQVETLLMKIEYALPV